jgi:hypothetical protein
MYYNLGSHRQDNPIKVFRNYRNILGGGVLIAVKDTHIATAVPELNTDC